MHPRLWPFAIALAVIALVMMKDWFENDLAVLRPAPEPVDVTKSSCYRVDLAGNVIGVCAANVADGICRPKVDLQGNIVRRC